MKKIIPLLVMLSGCSSAPVVIKSLSTEEVDQCKNTLSKLSEFNSLENENKDKVFNKIIKENKKQISNDVDYISKYCGESLKWNFVKNDQNKEMLILKNGNSEISENDELISVDTIAEELYRITKNFDELILKIKELKLVQSNISEKENRLYVCSSGEKRFATKIKMDSSELNYDIELSAFLYAEEVNKKKKFDLNLDLNIVGIELKGNSNKRFAFPENYLEKDISENHIELKRKIVALAQKSKYENEYFFLPATLNLSTDSGCVSNQELSLKIHEKKINKYKEEISQADNKNQYYQSCLKESKDKLIQQLFAQSNVCKINACIKEFNNWGNREKAIAARSGYINKLVVRAVGEYTHHYECKRKVYYSVLNNIGASNVCPNEFKVKSATIFGNDRSGYMCFVKLNLQSNKLSDCARTLIGVDENGVVSNHVSYINSLSNGFFNFSEEVARYASQKEAKNESKSNEHVLDPDEQMKKDAEENIKVSSFELVGPEGMINIVDRNYRGEDEAESEDQENDYNN